MTWYLEKINLRWSVITVERERLQSAILKCRRVDQPATIALVYVPRYGRVIEDVHFDSAGVLRRSDETEIT